jgi:hypothetical protein
MRRREVLAGISVATVPALAGCGKCGETWTGVGFRVQPTSIERTGDSWRVDASVEILFDFGRDGTGVFGCALAAFDDEGRVVGETQLGDLLWDAVADTNRNDTECGSYGRLTRSATVDAAAFPRWVGIRYDETTTSYTEPRDIARYHGDPTAESGAQVDGYEPVAVSALPPSHRRPATTPPVEDLTFRPGKLTCHPPASPEIRYSLVNTTLVTTEYARQVPAPHFRPTLDAYSYGDVLQFDIGLAPRPQLQRTDCTAARYEVSTEYGALDPEPRVVELRHLDRRGQVIETVRRPIDPTPTPSSTATTNSSTE